MHKLILVGGIGLVIVAALAVWVFIAGFGFISDKLPQWVSSAEKIGGAALGKAQESLPLLEEKARALSPEIAEKIKAAVPAGQIPATDVGGEDIAGVPRFPGLVRVSFEALSGKKTVGYKGRAELAAVVEFYGKEMASLGFRKRVTSASAGGEAHEYSKGGRKLGFSFKKTAILGVVTTEIVITELLAPGK
ncbi:MAG: hypothetical protein RDU13_11840 [Elusimicrobiales bacterium]|jgi:hypothetical protein|nr:hypothetical protein [Elusimicrobiales bacterium]